jgi:hypothetical protein
MPTVTTQYLMFVPRRRRIGGAGTTIPLVPAVANFVTGDASGSAPDTIEVHYPQASSPAAPANFAFWSVLGSTDGEYTDRPGTPGNFIDVHTGTSPVTMTAWYVFAGGGGGVGNGGVSELETDAFLVDQNQFVDPTPIESVSPPAAWDQSDVQEFVFTSESSDVLALESVVDPHDQFETWYALEGNSVPGAGRELHVPRNDTGIAVATYRIPPPIPFKPPREPGLGGTIVGGVAHDGSGGIIIGGHFHPIGPWNPFLAALSVYEAAKALQPEARALVQIEAMRAIASEAQHLQEQLKSSGPEPGV